jgi:hypothetical protein
MDPEPESPNLLRPGRKAGTMMSPTQVFRGGAFALSIGTPGSYGILQTQVQMILNVLEFGLNVQEAIEAPRVRVYRDRLVDAEAPSLRTRGRRFHVAATRSTPSTNGRGSWAADRASRVTPTAVPSWPAPTHAATATRWPSDGGASRRTSRGWGPAVRGELLTVVRAAGRRGAGAGVSRRPTRSPLARQRSRPAPPQAGSGRRRARGHERPRPTAATR